MIIGIDARIVEFRNYGITRYAENLIAGLSGVDKVNKYYIYCSLKGRRHILSLKLGKNFFVKTTYVPLYLPLEDNLFSVILEQDRPDIFHSISSLVPSRRICPSVVTVHDIIAFKFETNYLTPIERLYYRSAVQRAAHILTVSGFSKREIVSFFGIDESRVTAVYNGVGKFIRPPKIMNKRRYLLYVGSVQDYKNVGLLLRAFDIVRRKDRVRLFLVVHDTLGIMAREKIKELLRAHKISPDRIHVIKNISDERLGRLYANAEAFVFPSLYEGFGLPVIEAMAHGTAVIASDKSCIPEITDGASLNVDMERPEAPAEAILRVLQEPDLKRRLQILGRKRARFFKWSKCAKETLAVYTRIYEEQAKYDKCI